MHKEIQMHEQIKIRMNGNDIAIPDGCTVAVAIAIANLTCRTSISGEKRASLCAMGICFECRAIVNGTLHVRTCQLLCEPAMDIRTS